MLEAKAAEVPAAATVEALFQRRMEFHPARKPFSPISSSGGGFQLETLNPGGRDSHRPAASPGGPAAAASTASGKRSDGGEFYEHGLDPELSFRITFRRIGAGLANLGNTCFLNSVLQCLTYTEPFAAYLQSGKHKSSCRTAGFCAMCALQNHVMIALQSTGKILSPSHLVKNLRCISRNFRNSRQEDAHEYMVNLLESMHKCCLPSGVPSESPNAYEKSLVHKIFGGCLRSQVKCMQCSYCSNKFDPFLDLSLEIVKADSLRKALVHFTAVEQLDGGERQYQCQRCKEKVRALKQLTIHKAPHVLTIHLKRFGSHIPGQKIDRKVEFEPTLDLKPFVSDSHEGDLKYTLYGVLVHAGWSTHSGHYYCFVRTSSGMWHNLDDNQVYQVSEKTVLAQKAYMLFYVRDKSSTVKKSIDVVHKENISSNAPAHKSKEILQSALVSKGAAQSTAAERRFSTSEFRPAKLKIDATSNGQSSSMINTSSDKPLQEQASSLQNGNMKQNETSVLQNNGCVMQKEGSYLQSNGELPKGLKKSTRKHPSTLPSAKDSNMPAVTTGHHRVSEDLMHPVQLVHGSVLTTGGNGASFTPETSRSNNGRCHVSDGCNSEAKSDTLVAELNKAAVPKQTSEGNAKKLDMKKSLHENGDTANGFVQSEDADSKIDSNSTPAKNEPLKLLKQLSLLNTSIEKEALERVPVQHQDGGESRLKLVEPRLVKLQTEPCTENGCVQKEAIAEAGTEQAVGDWRQTELKLKRPAKLKGMYFGRKELFLTAVCLRKNKKLKITKKRRLRNLRKNSAQDALNIDDQGASTSEAAKVVGADAKRPHRKRPSSNLNRESDIKGLEDEKHYIGNSMNGANRGVEERNSNDSVTLATSERPKRCVSSAAIQCNSRETGANDNGSLQRDFLNLLMRGLKEPTVARWDDIELPKSERHRFENSRNSSIGYVLDEWDEEYDRGRRKKVKKSREESFDRPNLFQETANIKVQQKMKMKMHHNRSGNQPLRI